MSENKRILWLIVVMMAAVTISTAVAIGVLYWTAFEQERSHLLQTAEDQAHLMDAVARFDQLHGDGESGSPEAATLSQITTAFEHYPSNGQMAEITVAQRRGEEIVYLVTHGRPGAQGVAPVPFDSSLSEAMRRALSGHSGSVIGPDYRGVTVLGAYHPVPLLNAGVVAKMDMAQIRAPFLRGAAMVIGLALVLVTVGTVLFVRLTDPIVRHLNDTERRYQHIFRGAPVPIWEQDVSRVGEALVELKASGVRDLDGHLLQHPEILAQLVGQARIKEANAAALKLFGARSGRQFVAWFERALVPVTLDLSTDAIRAIWDEREAVVNHPVGVKTLDGRDLTVILSMVIPRARDGYHSVPVSALDVTAEENLRGREDELRLILGSTGEGIFGMDVGGRCSFVNRAACRMLGYEGEGELLGREMHALVHHTCRDGRPLSAEDCPILLACCQNKVVRLEDEALWRADGTSFPADYRSYPMVRDGAVIGSVVTFTDITERKEREAQLVQAQKMDVVGQLTGAIAHDFNNLLAIISTNLHLLDERLEDHDDAEIGELLDDARHTSRFLRRVTGEAVSLVVRRAGGALPVRVDRQQLENALLNLSINARDAMPTGGTLTIAAGRQTIDAEPVSRRSGLPAGNYVVIRISDTGVGMSPEVLRRAVEPFYSTKPIGKGSGLGLSSVLGFAQQS
nr:PAS domain S-box protein [Candidatus Nanopelagicales bacterium]